MTATPLAHTRGRPPGPARGRGRSSPATEGCDDVELLGEHASKPADALTFGAVLQTARLFGGELGTAFVQTFVRGREQIYSNLIGLHVTVGSGLTDQRLQDYAQIVAGRSAGSAEANARATALLARAVQDQANVLAFIDAFMFLGFTVIGALVLMLLLRDPPAPGRQFA